MPNILSILKTKIKGKDSGTHICNLSPLEVEKGPFWLQSKSGTRWATEDLVSKDQSQLTELGSIHL